MTSLIRRLLAASVVVVAVSMTSAGMAQVSGDDPGAVCANPSGLDVLFHGSWDSNACDGLSCHVDERHTLAGSGGEAIFCLDITGSGDAGHRKGKISWNHKTIFHGDGLGSGAASADSSTSNLLRVNLKLTSQHHDMSVTLVVYEIEIPVVTL